MIDQKTSKVIIFQRILPYYRVDFFRALSCSNVLEVKLCYGMQHIASSLKSEVKPSGISISRVRNIFFGKKGRWVYQSGIVNKIVSTPVDCIVLEFDLRILSNYLALLVANVLGVRIVFWGHGIGPNKSALSVRLRLWMLKFADAMIFYDDKKAELFIKYGLDRRMVYVARNSINTKMIRVVFTVIG